MHQGWVGRPLRALEEASGARVAYVTRYGDGILPTSATVLQENDTVHVLMRADAAAQVERVLTDAPEVDRMRVVIAGAGSVGRSIARELLAHDHEVTLVDRQPTAMRVAQVADADWLLADACELPTLREVKADECDVMVAATGDDKANLVISLLAKTEFGVPRTVARVNNPKNEWMFDEAWGVDVAVSTPRIMTAMVEEAVTVGDLVRIFTFHQSRADILELTLPEDSPARRRARRSDRVAAGHRARVHRARRATDRPEPRRHARGPRRAAVRHGSRGGRGRAGGAADPRTSDQLIHSASAVSGRPMASFAVPSHATSSAQVQRHLHGEPQREHRRPTATWPARSGGAAPGRRATRRAADHEPPLDSGPSGRNSPITRPTSGQPTRIVTSVPDEVDAVDPAARRRSSPTRRRCARPTPRRCRRRAGPRTPA